MNHATKLQEVAGVPDGDRDIGTLPLANQISASEGDKSGVLSLELLSGIDIDDNNEVDLGGTTKEQLALDTTPDTTSGTYSAIGDEEAVQSEAMEAPIADEEGVTTDTAIASAPSDTTVSPLPPSKTTASPVFIDVDDVANSSADGADHDDVNGFIYAEYVDCLEFHQHEIEQLETLSMEDDMTPTVSGMLFWPQGKGRL